jgi:1-acyl-sn-glycerol-3-phosphate acyltransferase
MKLAERILRHIFGIYALIIFVVVLIIATTAHIIVGALTKKERTPFVAHKWVSRPWASLLFILYGIRLRIHNRELIDQDQTYVFIGNHRSLLDIPAYAISTNHVIRFLAKAELLKFPLLGYVISKLYISVDRKDKAARAKSMDNMVKSLREGISVFICPEGTRNKTDKPLLPFHDGAFRLAILTQLPIAVLVIENSDRLLSPKDPFALRPGIMICHWCEPIQTSGLTPEDLPMLKAKAAELMQAKLVKQ